MTERQRRWNAGFFCALFNAAWIGFGCNSTCDEAATIQFQFFTIDGTPADSLWVLLTEFETEQFSWWSQSGFETVGDTLWTDLQGQLMVHRLKAVDCKTLMCGGGPDSLPCFLLPLDPEIWENPMSQNHRLQIPTPVWFNLVGNRQGTLTDTLFFNGLIEEPAFNVPSSISWFTPGQPPKPNVLIKSWVHPNEEFPACRNLIFWNQSNIETSVALCSEPLELRDTLVKNL